MGLCVYVVWHLLCASDSSHTLRLLHTQNPPLEGEPQGSAMQIWRHVAFWMQVSMPQTPKRASTCCTRGWLQLKNEISHSPSQHRQNGPLKARSLAQQPQILDAWTLWVAFWTFYILGRPFSGKTTAISRHVLHTGLCLGMEIQPTAGALVLGHLLRSVFIFDTLHATGSLYW